MTVNGLGTSALTGSATVTAQTATSMTIDTANVRNKSAQNVAFSVLDQYGQKMTSVTAANITVTAYDTTHPSVSISGTLSSMDFSTTSVGDVVKVTAFLTSNPTVTVSANVTVSNITAGAVTLGDPVLPTGVSSLLTTTAGVTIPVTVTDNYGSAMKLTAGSIASGATDAATGLVVSYSSNINSVTALANGNLSFTLGAAGAAYVTVTNPATGSVVTKNFTVLAAPDTATFTMSAPTTPLRVGGAAVNIPFTLADQYGNAMSVASPAWATSDVQINSSNTAVATVAWAGNSLQVTPVATGSATIFVTVVTSAANGATATSSLPVTVLAAAQPTNIALVGTPTTSLAQGQTVVAAALTGALKFAITDQDGNAINLPADSAGAVQLNLTVNDPNHVLAAPVASVLKNTDMSGTVGTTKGITVTAAAVNGSATVTGQLFVDANGNGKYDPGETLLGSTSATYTVSSSVLAKGAISAIAGATGSADFSGAYAATNTNTTLTYALQDQAGQALTTAAAVPVVWTITNTGITAMTVNDGTDKTLAAGATATYTTQSSVGAAATATIQVNSASENQATVSVAATGVNTPATTTITWTDSVVAASQTYTGTVQSFDTTAHWLVVKTAIGYVVVDNYAAAGTFTAATYTVQGNSATMAQFGTALAAGKTVTVTTDATPNITLALN